MPTQGNRRTNLKRVLRDLESEGYVTHEAQALYLGGSTTAHRLASMLAGGDISAMFAARVEHVLFKPRGWMSEAHPLEEPEADAARSQVRP